MTVTDPTLRVPCFANFGHKMSQSKSALRWIDLQFPIGVTDTNLILNAEAEREVWFARCTWWATNSSKCHCHYSIMNSTGKQCWTLLFHSSSSAILLSGWLPHTKTRVVQSFNLVFLTTPNVMLSIRVAQDQLILVKKIKIFWLNLIFRWSRSPPVNL